MSLPFSDFCRWRAVCSRLGRGWRGSVPRIPGLDPRGPDARRRLRPFSSWLVPSAKPVGASMLPGFRRSPGRGRWRSAAPLRLRRRPRARPEAGTIAGFRKCHRAAARRHGPPATFSSRPRRADLFDGAVFPSLSESFCRAAAAGPDPLRTDGPGPTTAWTPGSAAICAASFSARRSGLAW